MLGAVQVERPPAQEPREQYDRGRDPDRQARGVRQEDERERREQGDTEQRALAWAGHAGAAEERRQGQAEPHQAAQQRDTPDRRGRSGHRALADRAVAPGEGPEALARDHDPFGARHPAEARKLGCPLGPAENRDDPGAIHPDRIAAGTPPGKCRAAYLKGVLVLPAPVTNDRD